MYKKHIVSLALVGVMFLAANQAYAKGGTTTSDPMPTITTGSCDLANPSHNSAYTTELGSEWNATVVHPEISGGALIHIVATPTNIYASSICLEEGWTLDRYKVSGTFGSLTGFETRFNYQGVQAVDIRQVFGWYEAKYY
jgi:hypothetical protein